MRIVVVGGVAAGMSAASQAKRRRVDAEVIVLERGPYISYGACGIPFNVADPARDIHDLVVLPAERARLERGIDVRVRSEVLDIDLARKLVLVHDLATGQEYELGWDSLVLATGARAVKPPLPGMDLPGVMVVRELTDGAAWKHALTEEPRAVVVIGAGYIGVEMAEAFQARGVDVTVLEKMPQVIPGWDPRIAAVAEAAMKRGGVRVETGIAVRGISADGRLEVATDRGEFHGDLVLVATGIRPNVDLAARAGIALGATGAIAVDERMRTNVDDVYAAGDCAEAFHKVLGAPAWIPLGTTANKQGKIAGANAAGDDEYFGGIVGTAGFKAFGVEVARTGLGIADIVSHSKHGSRGHAYPGAKKIETVLFVERETRRLVGAQMAGEEGVTGRIDVLATALHARMTIDEVAELDLAYAPPFSPVWDPVLIAATAAKKELRTDELHHQAPFVPA